MTDVTVTTSRLPLELWGGHECTVNRVRDEFRDQAVSAGHRDRPDDIARFAGLGVKRLRYPILWEHVSPSRSSDCDWAFADRAVAAIDAAGVSPIVGLIHHGSGPAYVDLLSPDFATGLARYARKVAERFPSIRDWTPINEPLTTARFSLLYGHWYPHLRDERSFWLGLLNQIDATRLAMRAVRRINPDARLIQTEDLGYTYSTREIADQAAHDNLRRWATWDLLCGRLDYHHPMWPYLARFGLGDRLRAIADDPCAPDIIGVNHYVTSDRFLDHRLGRYPVATHGGNAMRRFADVEAARVAVPPPGGLANALVESWERYGRSIAITELHIGCTREEQLRWLAEGWATACTLRDQGVDIRAVTAWSLLGAYDWNSLLTERNGHYECGVYDVRAPQPRATAAATLLRQLAHGQAADHPVLVRPGWWRRNDRLLYPPWANPGPHAMEVASSGDGPPILITGATGTLGKAFGAACTARALPHILSDRSHLSLDDPQSIDTLLDQLQPWTVINAAGWVRVDDAEHEAHACMAANYHGSIALARACAARGIHYITFSSDLVFDGASADPYLESAVPAPLNVYGRSKARADQELLAMNAPVLIIRTAAFFSPHDDHNFAMQVVRHATRSCPLLVADDVWISPTYVPDLVSTVLDLAIDRETGLWHLANDGAVSWSEFAEKVAMATGTMGCFLKPTPSAKLNLVAPRPRNVAMASVRGRLMPPLDDAIARFAASLVHERSLGRPDVSGR